MLSSVPAYSTYYIVSGVFRDRESEMVILIGNVAVITIYCIVEFSLNVSAIKTDPTAMAIKVVSHGVTCFAT